MGSIKHPLVVLGVNRETPWPEVVIYGTHVRTVMSADAQFAGMAGQLATLGTDLGVLTTAQAATKSRATGLADIRDTQGEKVHLDLDALRNGVQLLVNTNPTQATEIAAAAGMHLRAAGVLPDVEDISAEMTGPDTAVLKTRAVEGAAYEWQVSTNGIDFVALGISTVREYTIRGLVLGATMYFRVRTVIGQTPSLWSKILKFIVH